VRAQGQLSRGRRGARLLVAAGIRVQSVGESAAAYRRRRWPTTDAEVTRSTVSYLVGGKRHYEPQITYTYRVGDDVYINDRLWFGSSLFLRQRSALEMANRYPVGAHLRVSYSPEDPHSSVIQPGIQSESIAKVGLAAGIMLAVWLLGNVRRPFARAMP